MASRGLGKSIFRVSITVIVILVILPLVLLYGSSAFADYITRTDYFLPEDLPPQPSEDVRAELQDRHFYFGLFHNEFEQGSILEVKGTEERSQILKQGSGSLFYGYPALSPDEKTVAFLKGYGSFCSPTKAEIILRDVHAGTETIIFDTENSNHKIPEGCGYEVNHKDTVSASKDTAVEWSPDGSKILFSVFDSFYVYNLRDQKVASISQSAAQAAARKLPDLTTQDGRFSFYVASNDPSGPAGFCLYLCLNDVKYVSGVDNKTQQQFLLTIFGRRAAPYLYI
jgi:hypothetical protein